MPSIVRKHWPLRYSLYAVLAVLLLAIVAVGGLVFAWTRIARTLPPLHGWHLSAPASEFEAEDADGTYTFADYIAQEDRVFAELAALVKGDWSSENVGRYCRFQPDSVCNPATLLERNWNRSYVLEADSPIGGALLVHGLSDSPYSLRSLAQRLRRDGYTVIGLRVPGHGTCPKALAQSSWKDWAAAVRVAMEGLRERVPNGPLVMVGYSNGGALSVNYTATVLRNAQERYGPLPDAIVLFSPMIGITPLAEFTELFPLVAKLSGEKKLAWTAIEPEIDPFKYSSWPINASLQGHLLTKHLEKGLAFLSQRDGMKGFPPVLAMQSAADATVVVPRLIDGLMDRLPAGPSELVLFDVDRASWLKGLLDYDFETALQLRLKQPDELFTLSLVTNRSPDTPELICRTRRAGQLTEADVGGAWPQGVFSLSHVALTIEPTDPVYGAAGGKLPLGRLSVRGENGLLAISSSLLSRMRHNPFYDWTQGRVLDWLRKVSPPAAPRTP